MGSCSTKQVVADLNEIKKALEATAHMIEQINNIVSEIEKPNTMTEAHEDPQPGNGSLPSV